MATTDTPPTEVSPGLTPGRSAELDQVVARARTAAHAFRDLDQAAVDRIVRAMVVAGLEHAVELALLAVEETGFGVIEDKVVQELGGDVVLHVLARRADIEVPDEVKVLVAPLPGDLAELAAHPLVHEKLMPVLGLVKAESVEHAVDASSSSPRAAVWGTPPRCTPATRPPSRRSRARCAPAASW